MRGGVTGEEASTIDNTLGRDTMPTPARITDPLIIRRDQRLPQPDDAGGLTWIFWLIVVIAGVSGGTFAALSYFLAR